MRKYVLIPDSFKGTMSSLDVCRSVTDAILSQEPDAAVCAIPVADGGEGTVDAFLSAVGGQRIPVNCTGPYGEPIPACYGLLPDGTAVVEDDLELTASSLRRYGTRLYVLGDAVIPAESADLLAQIEFLHVTGEVELPDALEAAFFAIPELECGKVVHEDALPKQTRAKAKDEEPDPDTVTLSGIQLTL